MDATNVLANVVATVPMWNDSVCHLVVRMAQHKVLMVLLITRLVQGTSSAHRPLVPRVLRPQNRLAMSELKRAVRTITCKPPDSCGGLILSPCPQSGSHFAL